MIPWFCPALFGVYFCIVVLGSRYTLKLPDRAVLDHGVVSAASFLTGSVFDGDVAHR